MEFGNITSICKYMVSYGGIVGGKPIVGSVTCKYDRSPVDREVTLLVVATCPAGKRGCISLEQAYKEQCKYVRGILQPIPTVRPHYSVVCNHLKDGKGNPVSSERGQGTGPNVHLPASEKGPEIRERGPLLEILKRTETVLVVDDEETVLDVCQEMLETMGCRVFLSKSGREALDVYNKHKDEIDIVMLDMIMPQMSGGETYDQMKQINPNVKVLLWSGYSVHGQATEILERGANAFIQKPFDIEELSGKIREVLDKP
jgi:CheY-like chemotaxis protein